MSELSLKPGISLGPYPQRQDAAGDELELMLSRWFGRLRDRRLRKRRSQAWVAKRVKAYDKVMLDSDDAALDSIRRELRLRLQREGLTEPLVIQSFALVREVAARVLGKRHFDTQLYGGWLMMNGKLAEMQTGEGKTLTTTLPACTAALAGTPVHVITANDYLAARDCEILSPLYRRLGLRSASVIEGMTPPECQQAYQTDIVHTTNKQIAFDYLRDRIEMGEDTGDLRMRYRRLLEQRAQAQDALLLRGLCFAIVDEADSVLIDEANTPLIITRSVESDTAPDTYSDALYLASQLEADRDYRIDLKLRCAELTRLGEERLAEQAFNLPKLWRNERKRHALVKQALAATHLYLRDREYLVVDDQVQIIDQSTGRVMADRSWEQGLHQMIEAKEGCVISEIREPQARISYQRFFSRYLRLGGTSGTLAEVRSELGRVYGLDVVTVATHQPSQRRFLGEKIYATEDLKQQRFLERVSEIHADGRPLLIGTASVEASEQVADWLRSIGIEPRVLNAKQDQQEAEIVAAAGATGAVTVATNMAGRGTDIPLAPEVEALGGLHVISLNPNPSYRVDRQLYGRCARQGDPGSAEAMYSLEDAALTQAIGAPVHRFLQSFCLGGKPLPSLLSRLLLRTVQRRHEAKQNRIRKHLMKQDSRLRRTLAFAGRFE